MSRQYVIDGDFLGPRINELSGEVERACRSHGTTVLVDLSRVQFIDSYGLGGLIYCHNIIEKRGKTLTIKVNGSIKEVLASCNLDTVLSITDSS
ncbi:MAG: STAS domain-containing protein [Chitinivibrionales bacterium]|nr:STAS domain-containing protein [Chitinivibrionales bacterium]